MKRTLIFTALALLPMQANALLKVINLSTEPQHISFEHAGTVTTKIIPVNGHEYFFGSDGMLSIDTSKQTVKGSEAQPGVISRTLGTVAAGNRTEGIPASDQDVFVVWPDGRLLFQQRVKNWGGN